MPTTCFRHSDHRFAQNIQCEIPSIIKSSHASHSASLRSIRSRSTISPPSRWIDSRIRSTTSRFGTAGRRAAAAVSFSMAGGVGAAWPDKGCDCRIAFRAASIACLCGGNWGGSTRWVVAAGGRGDGVHSLTKCGAGAGTGMEVPRSTSVSVPLMIGGAGSSPGNPST
jgi:hypothetical protein